MALRLAEAPADSPEAERLKALIQAVEDFEAERGWMIADDLRLSRAVARFRAERGLTP